MYIAINCLIITVIIWIILGFIGFLIPLFKCGPPHDFHDFKVVFETLAWCILGGPLCLHKFATLDYKELKERAEREVDREIRKMENK